jgi:hypothetical protein
MGTHFRCPFDEQQVAIGPEKDEDRRMNPLAVRGHPPGDLLGTEGRNRIHERLQPARCL